MALTPPQIERYGRHLTLPEVGAAGQERLLGSSVLIVGAGGLGSPAAFYLASAGVGVLGIVDGDVLEESNLQRQILHTAADVGRPKIDSAAERLTALNPDLVLRTVGEQLDAANGPGLVGEFDFVIDATDSFAAKFLIADVCHEAGRPYSHAGIDRFFGQTMTVLPGRTACYRCIFGGPPADADAAPPAGPVGAVPGVIGSVQAMEALKYLLGVGRLLTNRLLTYDALAMSFRTIDVKRNAACALCGSG